MYTVLININTMYMKQESKFPLMFKCRQYKWFNTIFWFQRSKCVSMFLCYVKTEQSSTRIPSNVFL